MAIVYSHNKPCGEVFYVGIGKSIKRAYNISTRTKYWKRIVEKYGYEVKIIRENIPYEKAKELEIFLIYLYGRLDLGKGTLCNLTDGGDGFVGMKYTKEHKSNISKALTGKKLSEERRIAFLKANKSTELFGRKVICVDTLKVWDSIRLCQIELNIPSLANYLNLHSETKNRTSIQYLEDYEKGIITCKQEVKQYQKSILNVNTGEKYKSIAEASLKNLGADRNTLSKHFKKGNEFITRFGFRLKLLSN